MRTAWPHVNLGGAPMLRKFAGVLLSALALILVALGEPSRAASAAAPGSAADPPEQRSRDILARIDALPAEPGWIARHVALDYESGFRISSAASYGKHRFDLRLRGPVYETPLRARNYGVIFELEF